MTDADQRRERGGYVSADVTMHELPSPPAWMMQHPMADRAVLLKRIADLWQGDWTGNTFDGRDGARWIRTAIKGDDAALARLAVELTEVERTYG